MRILKNVNQLEVEVHGVQLGFDVGRVGRCLFVSLLIDPCKFSLSLSLSRSLSLSFPPPLSHATVCNLAIEQRMDKYIGHITFTPINSNKWLLTTDGEFFLSLTCQHPCDFVPVIYPDR